MGADLLEEQAAAWAMDAATVKMAREVLGSSMRSKTVDALARSVVEASERIAKLDAVVTAARADLASYKTVGAAPTGALYMAVSGVEAERRLIALRDALRDLDAR